MSLDVAERNRLQHLYALELLDTPSEPAYDAFTRLAAAICQAPISLISLIDRDRQWFKSNQGLAGVSQTARDIAFCSYAIESDQLFEIADATQDDRFRANPLVTGDPNIRFYAGVPIIVGDGHAIGTLCVIDRVARSLTDLQREQLRLLALAVQALIDSRVGARMREHYDAQVRMQKQKIERTLATVAEAVITTDVQGNVEFMNPAAERLLHLRIGAVRGRALIDVLNLQSVDGESRIDMLAQSGHLGKERAVLTAPDGPAVHIEFQVATLNAPDEQPAGHVMTMRDVTAEHRQTAKLSFEASHDTLTGLYNRRQFEASLAHAVHSATREARTHTLSYLDLDRFKVINDTHGHAAGDFYLTELTAAMRKSLRGNDILARIGGDEFGLIMHDCNLEQAVPVLDALERLILDLNVPWRGDTLQAGVSCGTVELNRSTTSAAEALAGADRQCYERKRSLPKQAQ